MCGSESPGGIETEDCQDNLQDLDLEVNKVVVHCRP